MTTMTTRDKWLAAALPAMLTLLIGWLFFLRPAGREVAQLRQRVRNHGTLEARKTLVSLAQAEHAELRADVADKRRALTADDGVFDRNWAMKQVSLLCDANGLSLEKSAPDLAAQLPPTLKDALPAFATSGTTPQVWRLELSGQYQNVMKLLAGLQNAKPLIVPLNLSMQAGKTERQPATWVLTLWL